MNPRVKVILGTVVTLHITGYFLKPYVLPEKPSETEISGAPDYLGKNKNTAG